MAYNPEHIATLLFRRFTGEITPIEQRELEAWIQSSAGHAALVREIEDEDALSERIRRQEPGNFAPISARMLERVRSATQQAMPPGVAQVHRIHFLKKAWFKYAAAIILIVSGIAVYYNFSSTSRSNNTVVQNVPPVSENDVQPGSDRAVLTLSDGRQIDLGNVASETITDGNLTIENNDGQLIYRNDGVVAMNTMTTPKGGQYQLTLADGTRVWLNAASSITYPTAFKGNTRTVTITGEAYFKVAKDVSKPFLINVNNKAAVQVLGTSLNIKAYENEGMITATLMEGSVRVNAYQQSLTLIPGQQAEISATENGKNIAVVNNVDLEKVIAWKNGYFNFNDADIYEVMRQLERWYDIEVVFAKPVQPIQFHGELPRNLSLAQILEIFVEMKVNFKIEQGKKLIIEP